MTKEKISKLDACKKWVNGFNAVSQSLIERAMKDDIDNWSELTKPIEGDKVWSNEYQGTYTVNSIDYDNKTSIIDVEGEEKEVPINDITQEYDSWLPMWGWLWTFGESIDEEWTRENLELVSKCGFRIFEDNETGDIYLGIDGAGYNFYEQHWLPLYDAIGLQWHTEE